MSPSETENEISEQDMGLLRSIFYIQHYMDCRSPGEQVQYTRAVLHVCHSEDTSYYHLLYFSLLRTRRNEKGNDECILL